MKIPQLYFLSALIAISAVFAFFIFKPFLVTLILAIVFAVVLQPLYRRFLRELQNSPGLAAFATMLVAAVCILLPLAFIVVEVAADANALYVSLSEGGTSSIRAVFDAANAQLAAVAPELAVPVAELSASIDNYVKLGLGWLVGHVGDALGSLARVFVHLFIFLFSLYYFLRDGAKLKRILVEASPLKDADDEMVSDRLALAINSVIRGSLVIALIQGVLTAVGFAIFGMPNSILWGVVAAFAALIPGIGTSLVLVPGVIYLAFAGPASAAIGLLIWSFVVVGLIDNMLGPRLVGKGMKLHPLIVLLAVFGGLAYFGPAGVFLGPLCTSLLIALISLYPRLTREAA